MMAFATAAAARAYSSSASLRALQKIAVVGAGQMGAGIAQVAAQTGHTVTLCDVSGDILKTAQENINASLQRVAKARFKDSPSDAEKFIAETLGNLSVSDKTVSVVKDCDLVLEAVTENLDVKQRLFRELDRYAPKETLFASNTSSLAISEIAKATQRKDRFGGLHFFNPVPVMKLVEVVRTAWTSSSTNKALYEFAETLGKSPVQAKDTAGFIVNRLLFPYLLEAIRMVERGDAKPKDIDLAMKLGASLPMGPIELADYLGLDTCKFIMDGWHKTFPDQELYEPSEMLNKLVEEGKFGAKAGQGFYPYKK